jgi:hypothetical protein
VGMKLGVVSGLGFLGGGEGGDEGKDRGWKRRGGSSTYKSRGSRRVPLGMKYPL